MALGLLLATVLSYMYKFYYPVSEIHSTTAPLFLFAAHVFNYENRKNNFLYFLLAALIITWCLFIHVISIIPAFFILTYYISYTKELKKNLPILVFFGLMWIVIFMLSKKFLTTDYLASKMIGLHEVILFLKNPNAAAGYVYFKNEFLMNYLPLEILGISCLIFLIIKKEFLQVLTLLAFTIGTWLIIMAYNLHEDAPIVYMNYYGLFGFYFTFPFCLYAINFISAKKFTLIYLVLMVCSLAGIIRSGALMTDQVNYFKRVITNMQTPKGIVNSANIDWQSVWGAWDLSFQSLLISSIQNPQQEKTFFNTDDTSGVRKNNLLSDTNSFYNTIFSPDWFRPPFKNKKLYSLVPSIYTYLNTLQDSRLFSNSLLSNINIEIKANTETIYLLKNNFRSIPITLINNSSNKIPSVPSSGKEIELSYHVLDVDKKTLFYHGKTNRFEMDILPGQQIITGLCIDCTQLRRGKTYFLDVDVICNNCRWMGINKRIKIVLF